MKVEAPDAHALECQRRAGRIGAECRQWAREHIRPGVTIRSILETVEAMIAERGAQPAFPAQSSRNHVAAHYCSSPTDEESYEQGDCVKVDVGVHVDGYIADSAVTVDLSTDGRWGALIKASSDALAAAIASIEDGIRVGDIGQTIENTIVAAGFNPVRNLTGHGLGRWKVHTPPQIPNQAEGGSARLREGMIFAIEPFACTGEGYITERGKAEVFMMMRPPSRARGLNRDIMRAIDSWRGLPIARRYFSEFDLADVDEVLSKLARQGALTRFPPLVEQDGVMVAQTEHTLYLGPQGVEVLTA